MSDPMDYASDYEGDIGQGYPLPQANQRTTNLTGTLLKTGAIFALSPFANKAVEGILGATGKGVARGIVKLAGRKEMGGLSRLIGGLDMPESLSALVKRTSIFQGATTKFNKYVESKGIDLAEYGGWKGEATRAKIASIEGNRYAYSSSQRMARNWSFFKDRYTNYQAYRSRVWGGTAAFFSEYAKQLPGAVITDKIINFMTGNRHDDRNTAWWNLPGHVTNFTGDLLKASATYLPFYAGFKAVGSAATFAKDTIERAARYQALRSKRTVQAATGNANNSSSSFAADVLWKASKGAEKILSKVESHTQRIGNAYRGYKDNFKPFKRGTGFFDNVVAGAKAAARAYKDPIDVNRGRFTYTDSQITGNITNFLRNSKDPLVGPTPEMIISMLKLMNTGMPVDGPVGEAMKTLYNRYGRPRPGFFGALLGLRPLKYDKSIVETLRDTMKSNLPEESQEVIDGIVRMKPAGTVSGSTNKYFQKGVYDLGAGRVIDMTRFHPKRLISTAMDKVNEAMTFHWNPLNPKSTIRPLELMRVIAMKNYLLGRHPDAYAFTEGDTVRVGALKDDNGNQTMLRNDFPRGPGEKGGYNEYGATLTLGEDDSALFIRTGDRGEGKIFVHSKRSGTSNVIALDPQYRMVRSTLGDSLRRTQDTIFNIRGESTDDMLHRYDATTYKQEQEELMKNQGMSRWRAWMTTNILRTPNYNQMENYRKTHGGKNPWWRGLEVGAGYGGDSLFTKVGNFFTKFIRDDSPLVYLSKQRSPLATLKQVTTEEGGLTYITKENFNPMARFLHDVRGVLYDSYDEAYSLLKRHDVYDKFKNEVIDVRGENIKFGDLYDNTTVGRKKLFDAVDNLVGGAAGVDLPRSVQKVRYALDTLREDPGAWKQIMTRTGAGNALDMGDELRKFMFKTHIQSMADKTAGYNYFESTLRGGNKDIFSGLSGNEQTMVKAIDTLAHFESMAGSKLPRMSGGSAQLAKDLLDPAGREKQLTAMDDALGLLMTRHQEGTLEKLSRIMNPSYSTSLPNRSTNTFSVSTNTPYELVQVNKWFPFSENIDKFGLIRGVSKTLFPKYAQRNNDGTMGIVGDPIPTPTIFLTEVAMKLNRLGGELGFGLNLRERTTWDTIGKGMLTKIVAPTVGAIALYKSVDVLTDTSPIFAGSLKYEELVLVRHRSTGVIKYLKIGELVDKLDATEWDAWTNNGGEICFKPIIGGIRHKRETPLVRLELSNYSDILVTTNHSLFTGPEDNLQIVQPEIGARITQCSKVPPREVIYNQLNILDHLDGDDGKLLISVRDSRLDNHRKFNIGGMFSDDYHTWIMNNVSYSKLKYRCRIENANSCPRDHKHLLKLALYRSDIEIPIQYDLSYQFGYLLGVFIAEGSSTITYPPGSNSTYACVSICAPSKYSGYKGNVREKIINSMLSVFPDSKISISKESIRLPGYLYYKFFRDILDCGSGASAKRIPNIVMNGPDECVRGFLHGYFDGDGSYGSNQFVFTTVSRELACQLRLLLKQMDADVSLYIRSPGTGGEIDGRSIHSIYRVYRVIARNISVGDHTSVKANRVINHELYTNTPYITSSELTDQDEYVYDISVEGSEKFVAGTSMVYAHNTSLDEGISVALAEQYAKADMRSARLQDLMGITSKTKYLEGLMPGSMTGPLTRMGIALAPTFAGASVGMATGGPAGGLVGASIGLGTSVMMGMGLRDVTKSREELEDVYSGRELVPVRKGRFWEAGRTPYVGGRIQYWRPGWFSRLKSQYKYTPDMYGSKFEEFLYRNPMMAPFSLLTDPYHWERKSYFSSPTPHTAPALEEVPFIGPALSSTIGRAIKPVKTMHRDELRASFTGESYTSTAEGIGPGFFPPVGMGNVASPYIPTPAGGFSKRHTTPISEHSVRTTLNNTLYKAWVEPAGLIGFGTESALGGLPNELDTIIEDSGYRTSYTRAYWDMQLGGMLGTNEFMRRFIPRRPASNEYWNPLRNNMPDWLPGGQESNYFTDFKTGSAYTKIPEGELRLPGWGNMAAYHTKLSMPFRASQLGKTRDELVQYMTGTRPPSTVFEEDVMETGTAMHRIVQEELARANLLVKAEAPVYDPYSDVSGTIDAIVRSGRQSMVLELKTVSTEKLANLASPVNYHRSQINFYLKQTRLRQGKIIYISREDPSLTKTFNVTYDHGLYLQNMRDLQVARAEGRDILGRGLGNPTEAYSQLDRLRVLADVAPYSDEYKKQIGIVAQQDKAGLLSPEEHQERLKIVERRKAVGRVYDLYPRRFDLKGIIDPDETYKLMSQNTNIRAAAEYGPVARAAGGVWEYLTHQRSPIHSKLIGAYSPREEYERFVLYGKESAFWNAPWRDFVEPYVRGTLSTDRADEGVIRGLQAGFLLGGPASAVVGAGALGVYGAVAGAYRWATGSTYVPGNVKRKWEVSDYFDKLEYMKANRLYEMTGMGEYAAQMAQTMTGINPMNQGRNSFVDVARAVPNDIKPYIFAFMAETDPGEREKIAARVPDNVAALLRTKWALADKDGAGARQAWADRGTSEDLTGYFKEHNLPPESNTLWRPDVPLEDVQLKTVENMGMSAHDFGMGWYSQLRRIRYSPMTPGPIDITRPTGEPVEPEQGLDGGSIRDSITQVLRSYGLSNIRVNLMTTPGMGSRVTLNINVDHRERIREQLGL